MSVRYHHSRLDGFAPDYATCNQCGRQIHPPATTDGDLDNAIAWHVAACQLTHPEAPMTTAATPIPATPSTAERVLTALVDLRAAIGLSQRGISALLPLVDALISYAYERVHRLITRDADDYYAYYVALQPDADGYGGGAHGVAVSEPFAHPVQVIDFIACGRPSPFLLTDLHQGEESMMINPGHIPAEVFAPQVVDRGCRWPVTKPDERVTVKYRNYTHDPDLAPFLLAVRVRSKFPPPPADEIAEPVA
jgi:hypothetical protein